jgi:Ca2+/Na+ antiporter
MSIIQKPSFKFSTIDRVGAIFGIVFPIIAYRFSQWYWAVIVLLLIICVILIYHLYTYIKETNSLYNEYLKTSTNHKELAKQFEKKSKTLTEAEYLLQSYSYTLEKINTLIEAGFFPVSDYEIDYLKKIHSIISDDKSFLNNIERILENGKKNI